MKTIILQTWKRTRFAVLILGVAAFPALAADVSVGQSNQTFSTGALNIHVGDTVKFQNNDTVTHNITIKPATSDDDAEDLGLQKPGLGVSYKFPAKGAYRVVCSIHPRMKMTVNVQ